MKLDRSKPFGKISGDVFVPDGCDRPALYEQAGRFFDNHDRLIEPGVALAAAEAGDDDAGDNGIMTVADLLRQADTLHWRQLKRHAEMVLGPSCPATKALIIEALRAAQKEFKARSARAGRPRSAEPPAPVVVEPGSGGVDLAAWGMGRKEYLWGDVRKALKGTYGRQFSERDDAVEFLVDQGVITAELARKDVIRADA